VENANTIKIDSLKSERAALDAEIKELSHIELISNFEDLRTGKDEFLPSRKSAKNGKSIVKEVLEIMEAQETKPHLRAVG